MKFTDDIGTAEGAVDEGGPRREFLRLLMQQVTMSHIFEGPPEARNLSLNNSGGYGLLNICLRDIRNTNV